MSTQITTLSPRLPGIDVSGFQGKIDWATLGPHIRFAYIKATDGSKIIDGHALDNIKGATDNGVPFGLYHFFRNGGSTVGEESDNFLNIFTKYPSQLPPVLDLEIHPPTEALASLIPHAIAFLDAVVPHAPPMIYTSPSYASSYLNRDFTMYPLWIAHYTRAADPTITLWEGWDFWQWCDDGSLPGITGSVDLDWCVDEETLNSLMRAPT